MTGMPGHIECFFKGAGLDVYTPDVAAFRAYSNKKYLESPLSKEWPEGMVERSMRSEGA